MHSTVTITELQAQAPASAYALATSDDERAFEIAEAAPGIRAGRSPRGARHMAIAAASATSAGRPILSGSRGRTSRA